jgi:hypothetical protein
MKNYASNKAQKHMLTRLNVIGSGIFVQVAQCRLISGRNL